MKLLFVSQVPDTRLMGVPRVLYSVGDELARRGHTVDYFFENEIPRLCFPKAGLLEWSVRAAPEIGRRCKQKQYDAVIATTASGWCLSAFRKQLLPAKTRVVSWHHGFEALMWEQMQIEEERGTFAFSKQFKLYYNMILRANRMALDTQNGAFFTSTEERDWVRRHDPKNAYKAIYLPNGVSDLYYYPQRFDAEAPTGNAPRLLFVGYWDPWRKGRKYLSEAFTEIHRRHPNVRLTLAGTKLTAEQILPDFAPETHAAIDVIPHADEADLIGLYRAHDMFILPSLYEGMPLVLLEAMAAAMPVVATACTGMRDLITNGENGLLIPRRDAGAITDAVTRLIENAELRKTLGLAAFDSARTFYTWRQVTDIFEENLFRILHNKLQDMPRHVIQGVAPAR